MKRVLIGGYYGYDNLGDEIILSSIVARLRAMEPGLEVTAASADATGTANRHGIGAVDWFDIRALIAAAEGSDALLLGGGGLFHDYWGCDPEALLQRQHAGLPQYLALPLLASLVGRPLMIYGVGVGPLLSEPGRNLTRAAFEQASVATVRDEPSRALLAEIGVDTARVEVTADPAFDFTPPLADGEAALAAEGLAPGRPRVAVALRNWDHGMSDASWEGQVAEGLDLFLDRRGGEAVFIPFQDAPEPFGDTPIANRVRGLMKPGRHHVLEARHSPEARTAMLGGSDLVLGMRLHSLVLGARSGRPLVGLAYDPKVTAAMEQLGAGEHRLDLIGLSGRTLAASLDDAWQRRGEIGPRLSAAAGELSTRARANAEKAIDMLDRAPRPTGALTAALLDRTTLRLAAAVGELGQGPQAWAEQLSRTSASLVRASDENRQLEVRAQMAEAEVERWEASRTGQFMRVWRRLRGRGRSGRDGQGPGS